MADWNNTSAFPFMAPTQQRLTPQQLAMARLLLEQRARQQHSLPAAPAAPAASVAPSPLANIFAQELERSMPRQAAPAVAPPTEDGALVNVPALLAQAQNAGQAAKRAVQYNPFTPAGAVNTIVPAAEAMAGTAPAALGFDNKRLRQNNSAIADRHQYSRPDFGNPFDSTTPNAGMPPSDSPELSPYFQRILQIEGGMGTDGKFRTSPAGAFGPSQLMPGTAPEAMQLAGYDAKDSSWRTNADVNIRAGNAYYNKQLRDFGDPVLAAAAYNAGPGRVQQALAAAQKNGGSWQQYLPAETQRYVQNFAGGAAGSGFQSPFNAGDWGGVLAANSAATQAAARPFSVDVNMPDAPKFPDMPEMPKPDFSATDAQLEKLRPVMIDAARQKQIVRGRMWEGLAQGLAATPENAHWGKVLANLGAGMLQGRMAGDQEIQARMDDFDQKMSAFEMMKFRYDDEKSTTLYNSALKDYEFTYNHNLAKFNNQTEQFNKDWSTQVTGNGSVVATSKTAGGRRITYTPNASAIFASGMSNQAEILQSMAGAKQQGQSMVTSMQNQIVANSMLQQTNTELGQGAGDAAMKSFLGNADLQASELVRTGMASEVIGPDAWDQATKTARQEALSMGLNPASKEYGEFVQRRLGTGIMELILNNPQFRSRMQTKIPSLLQTFQAERLRDMRTKRTQDSKGRVSVTETF